jgi:sec-independent protein translocase protein TatB
MFDFGIGASELLIIAIVALLVVGPKDLPRLLRSIGQFTRKIQGMAREFQEHLNEAAKEAGVDDIKKEVKSMTDLTANADLEKESSDIKRAIESSAPKPAAAKPEPALPEPPKPAAIPDAGPAAPDSKAEAERQPETVKS